MWWKKGTIVVLIIFLISVTWGIIYVYNDIPKSLIGNSKFKIYCSKKPLEVRVETAGYNVYLVDGKLFKNIKQDVSTVFNKLIKDVKGDGSKNNSKVNDSEEVNVDNIDNDNLEDSTIEEDLEDFDKENNELKSEATDSNLNVNDGN